MADDLSPDLTPPTTEKSSDAGKSKPSLWRELWNKTKGVFWGAFGLKLVGEEIETHEHVVNKARVVVIVGGFCIAAVIFGWNVKGFLTEKKVNSLQSQVSSNAIALQIVQGLYQSNNATVQQLNFNLVRAENERDNARAKLAPFELLAAKVYTNELPTEALSRLYKDVQPDSFEVAANGVILSNGPNLIDIRSNRTVVFGVKGNGRYPAKGVTTELAISGIGLSNITTLGWQPVNGNNSFITERGSILSNLFEIRLTCDSLLTKSITWQTHPIGFSTNIPFRHLRALLRVYSERSDVSEYNVQFNLTK